MTQRSKSDSPNGYRRRRRTRGVSLQLHEETYEAFKDLAARSDMTVSFALTMVMAQAVADAGDGGRLKVELVR